MELINLGVDRRTPRAQIVRRGEVVVEVTLDGGVLRLKLLQQACDVVDLVLHVAEPLLISCLILRAKQIIWHESHDVWWEFGPVDGNFGVGGCRRTEHALTNFRQPTQPRRRPMDPRDQRYESKSQRRAYSRG